MVAEALADLALWGEDAVGAAAVHPAGPTPPAADAIEPLGGEPNAKAVRLNGGPRAPSGRRGYLALSPRRIIAFAVGS